MGSESNKDSRIKNDKVKNKLVFAKDKKQAILAMVIVFIFFAKGISMIMEYSAEQNRIRLAQQAASSANNNLTQQQSLESLTGANTSSTATSDQNMAQQQGLGNMTGTNTNSNVTPDQNMAQDANDIYSQTVNMPKNMPNQTMTTASSEGDIDIMSKKTVLHKNSKLVEVDVANLGRQNPFLPIDENPRFTPSLSYLLPPPETLPKNTDATKIMGTTISGILYDKYSPSAIINIEGNDYLVKKGDVINNYKILSINKTQVVIQLGKNIYQAGVGELLSQSNFNNATANLNKKFAGNDISINVKKKGY